MENEPQIPIGEQLANMGNQTSATTNTSTTSIPDQNTIEPTDTVSVDTAKPEVHVEAPTTEPTKAADMDPDSTNMKELDPKVSTEDKFMMPVSIMSRLATVLEKLSNLSKEEADKLYTAEDKRSLGVSVATSRLTNDDDMLAGDISDYENNLSYGDTELNIRALNINPKANKVSGDSLQAFLSTVTGIGTLTQVPLWHSGFWLTLLPIKDSDIINLEMELSESFIELGRTTSGLIYSNYSVIYNRIVTNFIMAHIQNSSLKVPNSELRKYILIQDFYPIINGILHSMNPNGYDYIRSCINNTVNNDEDKPKCDFILEAKINFKKLLRVNRKRLTTNMLVQMSKRAPDSLTIEQVKEYQKELISTHNTSKVITAGNGVDVKFTFKSPTLDEYIVAGEYWVNSIISKTEKLFTETTDDDVKNNLISEMTITSILGMYNSWVTKIDVAGHFIDGFIDITLALETLSSDNKTLEEFINTIKTFINDATVAMVGIPNYVCPTCKKEQNTNTSKEFKELVPINMVESFFDLATLRLAKMQ